MICELCEQNTIILLRAVCEHDLENIMEWRMKPEVTDYLFTDPILTLDMQKQWFANISVDNSMRYWIIEVNGISIGLVWLFNIDDKNMRTEWGWFIGDLKYRGQGIAKRIMIGIYEYVFNKMGFNRLYSEVLENNYHEIQNVYLKCGYKLEGILREHIYKRGVFFDVVRMGLTKDDWLKTKDTIRYKKYNLIIE